MPILHNHFLRALKQPFVGFYSNPDWILCIDPIFRLSLTWTSGPVCLGEHRYSFTWMLQFQFFQSGSRGKCFLNIICSRELRFTLLVSPLYSTLSLQSFCGSVVRKFKGPSQGHRSSYSPVNFWDYIFDSGFIRWIHYGLSQIREEHAAGKCR